LSGFSVALRLAKPAACVSKRPKHVLHARHAVARAPARAGTPLGDAARAAADHVQAPRDREPGTRAAQREGASCFVPARRTRQLPRNDPTGPDRTLLSYPQLRQDLADARRRATVAANAEAQAGIVVAMHREKQAEAARLRRELLVRDERKTRTFRLLSKHIWERAGSLLAVEKKRFRFSDVVSNPFLSPRRPAWARRARRSASSGSTWTRKPVCLSSSARSVCRPRTDRRGKTRTLRPPRRRLREGLFAKVFRHKTTPRRPRPSRGRRSAASRTRSFYTFLLRWKTPRRTPCRVSHRKMPSR
jgi:hypothetical protein